MLKGKACPICGRRTLRERMPLVLRALRWLLGPGLSYRRCEEGHWQGLARETRAQR